MRTPNITGRILNPMNRQIWFDESLILYVLPKKKFNMGILHPHTRSLVHHIPKYERVAQKIFFMRVHLHSDHFYNPPDVAWRILLSL